MQTLKRYYINVKFEKYGTYTFEAEVKNTLLKCIMMEIMVGQIILKTLESLMKS